MLVSVVIPAFNRGEMIRKSIDSAIGQDYKEKEVIVVDDCSTDDTQEIVADYGPEVRYIRHPENRGVGAARNTGIAAANGELIAFLDSDDWWLPNKLTLQVAIYKEYPDSGIIGAGCMYGDIDTGRTYGPTIPTPEIPRERISISVSLPGCCSNELIPANVLADIGGFAEDMVRAEDYHLMLRIAMKYSVRAVPEVLCVKGVHNSVRPGVDLEKTLACRKRVLELVEDPVLRKKHEAWMYFVLGERLVLSGRHLLGMRFLGKSILAHPTNISRMHKRLRPFLGQIREKAFT